MVTIINNTRSLSTTLNYNEKKLRQKNADCILASNYVKDLELLNFYDKLHRLEHQADLNLRAKSNSVHITLNFHEDDKLNKEKLQNIAEEYMQKIGFGEQPYLVYEHFDAGHQHVHIVTTNIRIDGTRIDIHNIGRNQSKKARKELEIKYNLVQAESRKLQQKNELPIRQVNAQKVIYGKTQTIRAITNVLDHVLKHYKFTSLPELNAVLKQYNVMADRGKEDSRMYEQKGLVYRVLDKDGRKIGTPIKASAFYNKPIFKELEKIFAKNLSLKQDLKRGIKVEIGLILNRHSPLSLDKFNDELRKCSIHATMGQNDKGFVYAITYIDHKSGAVINGSELGKEYSAEAVLEKCGLTQDLVLFQKKNLNNHYTDIAGKNPTKQQKSSETRNAETPEIMKDPERGFERTLEELLRAIPMDDYLPNELKQEKKQKQGLRQYQH